MSKLQAKSKKLVEDLSQKKIISSAPRELLDSDFQALKNLIAFFEKEDWKRAKRRLKIIRKKLLTSTEPIQKSDLKNFLNFTSIFQDTLKEKCQKFEALNKDDFWVDKTSIEPLLVEYSILLTGKPLSNPRKGSELHEILEGVNKFEASWLKKLDDLNNKTNEFLEKWNIFKSNESKLDSLLKNGQIDEVQNALEKSARFTDLNLKIRESVKLYLDIKKKGDNLKLDCEGFLKDSQNDKIWASQNVVLSNKISQSLKTIEEWISQLDTDTANGLKLDSDLVKWKDLAEETKAEVSKSIKVADYLAKVKKRKKNIFIFLVLATATGLFYFFEKDHREKQLLKLQAEADAFGVGIHALESAFDGDKLPSNFTGWRLLRDNKGLGYKLNYLKKGISAGFYCELYQSSKKPKEKGQYINGQKNGLWETWHPGGNKESEGNYTNGEKDGTWLYLASDGTREEKTHKTKAAIQAEYAETLRKEEAYRKKQIEEERRLAEKRAKEIEEAKQHRLFLQEREKNASELVHKIQNKILDSIPEPNANSYHNAKILALRSKEFIEAYPKLSKDFHVESGNKLKIEKNSGGAGVRIANKLKSAFGHKINIKSEHLEGSVFRSNKSHIFRCIPIASAWGQKSYFAISFVDHRDSMFRFSPSPISKFEYQGCYFLSPSDSSSTRILKNKIHFLQDPRIAWFEIPFLNLSNVEATRLSSVDKKASLDLFFDLGSLYTFGRAKFEKTRFPEYLKIVRHSIDRVTKKSLPTEYSTITGDTPIIVAQKNICSIEQIMELNKEVLFDPFELLKIGTLLKIPLQFSMQSSTSSSLSADVEKGDYLLDQNGDLIAIMVNNDYAFVLNEAMESVVDTGSPSRGSKMATLSYSIDSMKTFFGGKAFNKFQNLAQELK